MRGMIIMGTGINTRKRVSRFMADGEPFKAGNLSGKIFKRGDWIEKGWLPQSEKDLLRAAEQQMPDDATIRVYYSWETPIAWALFDSEGDALIPWYVPDVKYSPTTTHHQGLAQLEASNPGFYAGR
jgi:hypothetical protein